MPQNTPFNTRYDQNLTKYLKKTHWSKLAKLKEIFMSGKKC